MELRFIKLVTAVDASSKRWQNVIKLELVVMLLPALHHQLISVRFAVTVSVVHVLRVGSRMRETLQAFTALERLFTRMQSLVLSLSKEKVKIIVTDKSVWVNNLQGDDGVWKLSDIQCI